MRNTTFTIMAVLVLLLGVCGSGQAKTYEEKPPLPEFSNFNPKHWFNSPPLKKADLKGKVVLIDVWTFDCWNCYRSFPWLHELEEKFAAKDFQVIGIHTPEFSHEKQPQNVADKITQFKLQHPVMMDNNFAYWKALRNRYWPAFYLVDKQGRLRFSYIGETHSGDLNATAMEYQIEQMLKE